MSRPPLAIAVTQPRCVALDVACNARAHADAVRAARARVVVFPEMSLTGYELDAPAIEATDPRLEPIVIACAETGTVALVGAPVTEAGSGPWIGMLRVDGGGAAIAYRKMYLGADEARRFQPGRGAALVVVDEWRIGLAICRDTGIAEHAHATAVLGFHVYAAGVLEHAADSQVPEQRARRIAREHGVWVAIASFAGATGAGYACAAGGSGIWRAGDGALVARTGEQPGELASATLSPSVPGLAPALEHSASAE